MVYISRGGRFQVKKCTCNQININFRKIKMINNLIITIEKSQDLSRIGDKPTKKFLEKCLRQIEPHGTLTLTVKCKTLL